MDKCFKLLGLSALNEGVWCGATALPFKENVLSSENPHSPRLAEVSTGDVSDYQKLMRQAQTAVQGSGKTPAPKRGELVRLIGEALRCQQASLGRLIALRVCQSLQKGWAKFRDDRWQILLLGNRACLLWLRCIQNVLSIAYMNNGILMGWLAF